MKKILAFAGSNSSRSVNRMLVERAAARVTEYPVTLIDLREFDAPIFSEDLEQSDGVPDRIMKLKELFTEHDAFMIASPEHNGMMPAFFKNIMDWLSRTEGKIFQDKPVLLMSASPGPRGGQTNLMNMKALLPWWGASAVFADVHLGSFYQAFDVGSGTLNDPEEDKRLEQAVMDFESFLQAQ